MAWRVFDALLAIASRLPDARRDPLVALDRLTPSKARIEPGLAYGPHGGQTLDLFLPPEGPAARSAVLFFHGGRWSFGSKEQYRFVGEALAELGHLVAVCDYRKYPSVRFPAFVEDGAAAIAWGLRELPRWGVDPRLVFAMGHSSGAHIAALATMDRRYSAVHGVDPDRLAGLVLLSGPFDFYPIRGDDLREIFGPDEFHLETQPSRYVRPGLPPMLLLHGKRDRTVRASSSARMASLVRENGGDARVVLYDYLTHTNILAALSSRIGFLVAPVLDDVACFLARRCREIASCATDEAGRDGRPETQDRGPANFDQERIQSGDGASARTTHALEKAPPTGANPRIPRPARRSSSSTSDEVR
jgi:acetyl esterase/lipase